jgi:hypothetical protein
VLYTSWVVAGGVRLLWYVLSHAICSLFVLWRIKTSEISGKVIPPPPPCLHRDVIYTWTPKLWCCVAVVYSGHTEMEMVFVYG